MRNAPRLLAPQKVFDALRTSLVCVDTTAQLKQMSGTTTLPPPPEPWGPWILRRRKQPQICSTAVTAVSRKAEVVSLV